MNDMVPALTRFRDPAAFLHAAEPFLMEHEAAHCLPLGVCADLIAQPEAMAPSIYLAVVEAGGAVAAVAMRTPPHDLVLAQTSSPEALALIAADIRQVHPDLPGVLGPSAVSRTFADIWHRRTGRGFRLGTVQRIYELSTVRPVTGVSGRLRRATVTDRAVVLPWARAFELEAFPERTPGAAERSMEARLSSAVGGIYLWEDPGPVSLVSYGGPTPHGIRIGGVYTPPAHRRQGYASAAVATVSQLLLEAGRQFVFLFTDLGNPTSNHIYQAIGFRPVADVENYRFDDAEATAAS